ncbi:MAG: hypothetical protein KGN78_05060 [Actinomycetales bacterium]|nr:hypothetical protein [Actinomycetales bacterium]
MEFMRQAITTKYHGPTNTRGSRISATTESGLRHYYPYRYELNSEQNHRAAALAMAEHMGWSGTWRGGAIPCGYAFVLGDGAMFEVPNDTNR